MVIVQSCTTEKNAAMNRVYHQTTTKYNGLYNANELLKQSMRAYRLIHIDDYDEILPIEALPTEENQVALIPIMDTAVAKCMKVIAKHSMPAFNERSKKDEYNKWIDQAWLTTGYAKYYKGDYEGALQSFNYVEKFFSDKPAKYTARLWKAKCYIKEEQYVKADAILRELERDAENFDKNQRAKKEQKKSKKSKKKKKSKKSKNKEKPVAVPPSDFVYEYYKIKADLAIIRKKYEEAQRYMEIVVENCNNKEEAARMHFILAQLAVKNGQSPIGVSNYSATLKKKAPFVLHFTARLQRAIAATGPDKVNLTAELIKMANEVKNLEYRDQIYYALGNISQNDSDIPSAMNFYTKSVFYSINNAKQKGQSYERMADIKMSERDYVKAQKYYDSCARIAPPNYKGRDKVVRKANKLRDLVDAIETANLQDSLLRISAMSPAEQAAFLETVKKQLEKEEKERLERERAKAQELALMQQGSQNNSPSGGNRWYFYNPRTKTDGFEDFKRLWGQRELEDDWRRSNKMPAIVNMETTDDPDLDTLLTEPVAAKDPFSIETLMGNVPQSEEEIELAYQIMFEALYRSGRIYNEELLERELAIQQFVKVMSYRIEDKHVLLSAFELYRLYDGVNPNQRSFYADYILTNYPNSDYASFINDPDFFVKKKERERLDLEDYEKQVERFRNGQYSAVRSRTRSIMQNDPENAYRSGYMLLNALCEAALMENKKDAIPFFEGVMEAFPGSKEAKRSESMISIINNGFSTWEDVNFGGGKSEFDYRSGKMYFMLIANKDDKIATLKKDMSNFNSEFFSGDRLSTKDYIIGDVDAVRVGSFRNENAAKDYLKKFRQAKRTIKHLQGHTYFIITEDNLSKLIFGGNLAGYLDFYLEFY